MKRKILAIMLVAVFICALMPLTAAANANEQQISVFVDGIRVAFPDQQPVIVDGRTLVPVRGVFEELGFEVDWEGTTRTAILVNDTYEIRISVGSASFYVNGVRHTLDVPAQLIGGRTMVPLRLPLESVGFGLNWIGVHREVLVWSANALQPPQTRMEVYTADTRSTNEQLLQHNTRLLQLINNFRVSHGAATLQLDPALSSRADYFIRAWYGMDGIFTEDLTRIIGYERSLTDFMYNTLRDNRDILFGSHRNLGISMNIFDGDFYITAAFE